MPVPPPDPDLRAWFLVGPTASGKSAAAQLLAERDGHDILSADAMLVYRGLDIGTAKPTAAERARVPHHGLNLVACNQRFSVGAWRAAALEALRGAAARQCPVIVVGGTGLYIKSLTDGLAAGNPARESVRAAAAHRLAAEGVAGLQSWVRAAAPAQFAALADPCNPRRLVRALEAALAGAPAAAHGWRRGAEGPPIPGLLWEPAVLYDRIRARVQAMFDGGLLDEVERLMAEGLEEAPTARLAIGYAETMDCLRGRCSRAEAMERTVRRTRQLAKRQMTWFRRQCRVIWLPMAPDMGPAEIAEAVRRAWRTHGPAPIAREPAAPAADPCRPAALQRGSP